MNFFRFRLQILFITLLTVCSFNFTNVARASSCLQRGEYEVCQSPGDCDTIDYDKCHKTTGDGKAITSDEQCQAFCANLKGVKCSIFTDDACSTTTKECNGSVCTISAKTCSTNTDCEQPAGNFLCFQKQCYFDEIARQLYQGGDTGIITSKIEFHQPLLEFRIPGLSFTEVKNTLDSDGYIHLPYIGELVATIYKFGMAVGSIIAAVVVAMSGAQIIVSAGGEAKTEGYKRIGEVVIGLFIMWGSYALLYTINPDLVNFKALKVKYIVPVPLPQENDNISGEYPAGIVKPSWDKDTFDCNSPHAPAGVANPDTLELYSCDGIDGTISTIKEMHIPLCKVAALAKQNGYTFNIVPHGSFRTFEDQVKGWCQTDVALPPAERVKFRAVPGYSNHGHGRAVDLFPVKNGKQLYSASPRTDQCKMDVGIIETVSNFFYATDPKFKRLESEIWHFEYGTSGSNVGIYRTKPKSCN